MKTATAPKTPTMPPNVRRVWRAFLAECPRAGVVALRDELRSESPRLTNMVWANADSRRNVFCACPMMFPFWAASGFNLSADEVVRLTAGFVGTPRTAVAEWVDDHRLDAAAPLLLEVVEEFLAAKGAA